MQHGGLVSFVPDRRLLVMLKIKPARNPADGLSPCKPKKFESEEPT